VERRRLHPALTGKLEASERGSDRCLLPDLLHWILDPGYGKPTQLIDANITEDGGPVRYYAELPHKAESTEAWLQSLGKASGSPDPDKVH
jgi:hypothetical protein